MQRSINVRSSLEEIIRGLLRLLPFFLAPCEGPGRLFGVHASDPNELQKAGVCTGFVHRVGWRDCDRVRFWYAAAVELVYCEHEV